MGILEALYEVLEEKAKRLLIIQNKLDVQPLDNEELWELELELILEVDEAFKNYLNLLDKLKDAMTVSEYKKKREKAYNLATTGREYVI
jgi:predicted GTPase